MTTQRWDAPAIASSPGQPMMSVPIGGEGPSERVERLGTRAKCSFLLSVLSGEVAQASERAVAFLSLIDDIEKIARVLDPDELDELRSVLGGALSAAADGAMWSSTVLPDEAMHDAAVIEGTSVRRVVVAPADGDAQRQRVAVVPLPASGRFVVATEYTVMSDERAAIEIVDERTGAILGTAVLERGHNGLATISIDTGEASASPSVCVYVVNECSDSPVYWYQTTVESMPAVTEPRPIRDALRQELTQRRASDVSSVFRPVTGEPLTLSDVDRLLSLRDQFRGERIFIMGNGPSLNRTPLELLGDEYVFGVNRISLLFERVSWRPTFFTAFDVLVVPDNAEEFAALDVPYKFFSARYKKLLGERENHYWYHTKGFYEGFEPSFEPTAVYSGFGGGGTIAVIAVELAWFLGFREIYLIGTDVSYSVPTTVRQAGEDAFGDGVKLQLQSTRDDDPNHFDPRYFGKDKKWHNPNVRDMKIGFARAAAYIDRRGGTLRNATVGGELDEVPRVDFQSLF